MATQPTRFEGARQCKGCRRERIVVQTLEQRRKPWFCRECREQGKDKTRICGCCTEGGCEACAPTCPVHCKRKEG